MKNWILRKLFIWLGYAEVLNRAQERGVINNYQWHELDARFKRYPCAKADNYKFQRITPVTYERPNP